MLLLHIKYNFVSISTRAKGFFLLLHLVHRGIFLAASSAARHLFDARGMQWSLTPNLETRLLIGWRGGDEPIIWRQRCQIWRHWREIHQSETRIYKYLFLLLYFDFPPIKNRRFGSLFIFFKMVDFARFVVLWFCGFNGFGW